MAKQKITLEDLAQKIDGVMQEVVDVRKDLTEKIEDETSGLAVMTKRGFDKVDERFDKVQEENQKHFSVIKQEIVEVKLRQDNVAYRFELNALGERVTKLEKTR